MAKKIAYTTKPKAIDPDQWVENRAVESSIGLEPIVPAPAPKASGKIKRLTIDVSEDLHLRIRVKCLTEGIVMADRIRAILEREFPAS